MARVYSNAKEAGCYVRVSTLLQKRKGFSLPQQFELCREDARRRGYPGIPAANQWHDADTGKTFYRAGLQQMLQAAERGALEVVFFPKVDRMGRDARDSLEILDRLRGCGVKVVLVEDNIDTETPQGKLFFTQLAAFAEWEGAQILERTRNGRLGLIEAKRVFGTPQGTPYGLRWVPSGKKGVDGHYERFAAEAEVVLDIFERIARGETAHGVAHHLTVTGTPAPRGGTLWYGRVVAGIVHKTAYTGQLRKNQTRSERLPDRDGQRGRVVRVPNSDDQVYVIAVPRIVPDELFAAANAALARNKREAGRNLKNFYLLRGSRAEPLLLCGECRAQGKERIMAGRVPPSEPGRHRGGRYYACEHHDETGKRRMHRVAARAVEDAVWGALCEMIRDPDSVLADIKALADVTSQQARRLERELKSLEVKARENLQAQERLIALATRGKLADALLAKQEDELEREAAEVAGRMALLRVQMQQAREEVVPIGDIEDACALLAEGLEAADDERKRWIVRTLVTKVYATKTQWEMEGRLPGLARWGRLGDGVDGVSFVEPPS